MRRIVVGISGASGAVYGVGLLRELREVADIETHLIVSSAGYLNLATETGMSRQDLHALADVVHADRDIGATIASGSFATDAMVIAPCSMRTLAAVATGLSGTLLTRAADVTLKERRRLVVVPREAPLNLVHLRNLVTITEMGGIVFPPVPAFYAGLETIDEMVGQTVARILDLIGVAAAGLRRWPGVRGDDAGD